MRKVLLLLSVFTFLGASSLLAQDRVITGKVTSSEDGSSLPGVNVVVKGTTNGTVTDIDGNYKLAVPENGGTLVFSFIGLESQEIEIGNQSTLNASMNSDLKQLSEVIVQLRVFKKPKMSLDTPPNLLKVMISLKLSLLILLIHYQVKWQVLISKEITAWEDPPTW